ncbi:MAG: hypothetical protein QOC58_835 [Mycobacterium sp.]|nr:hypothetical protein [Mycobacterium sp.]
MAEPTLTARLGAGESARLTRKAEARNPQVWAWRHVGYPGYGKCPLSLDTVCRLKSAQGKRRRFPRRLSGGNGVRGDLPPLRENDRAASVGHLGSPRRHSGREPLRRLLREAARSATRHVSRTYAVGTNRCIAVDVPPRGATCLPWVRARKRSRSGPSASTQGVGGFERARVIDGDAQHAGGGCHPRGANVAGRRDTLHKCRAVDARRLWASLRLLG